MTRTRLLIAVLAAFVLAAAACVWLTRGSPSPAAQSTHAAQPQGTVLLIPGYGGGTAQFSRLTGLLHQRGIRAEIVDVGNGQGDLRGYGAAVVARAKALVAQGQPPPDLIGFSAGGLTARVADTSDPSLFRKVITLAAPHAGTGTADLGAAFGECPAACAEMRPDSQFLAGLPQPANPQDWLSVWSATDPIIRPPESSELPDVTNYRLQDFCEGSVDHGSVPADPQTLAVVSDFLADRPLPTSCVH